MKKRYDVIIVGAGPAGCSAATFIARKGLDVLLLDKACFPRDKVCGDGISPPALGVLGRMGLHETIKNKDPWKVDGIELISSTGKRLTAEFRQAEGIEEYGYVWPRRDFDMTLLEDVQSNLNVDVLGCCEVSDLTYKGKRPCGAIALHKGLLRDFKGEVIIGADGVHSVVKRKTSHLRAVTRQKALGLRAYFRDVQGLTRRMEIHWEGNHLRGYAWIFPTGDGTANVGLGIPHRFARGMDIKRSFGIFVEKNRSGGGVLHKARMVENTLKSWLIPLGSWLSKRSHKNVLLIGDAGGFADPVTGEGIYHALISGEFAAQAISKGLKGKGDIDVIGEIYDQLCRKAFKPKEYLLGGLLQRFLLNSYFLNFNISRAIRKPVMAANLVSILCHKKSKIGLILG